MKFNFKIQQFQTDAVQAVTDVFAGQSYRAQTSYIRDLGKRKKSVQGEFDVTGESDNIDYDMDDTGF